MRCKRTTAKGHGLSDSDVPIHKSFWCVSEFRSVQKEPFVTHSGEADHSHKRINGTWVMLKGGHKSGKSNKVTLRLITLQCKGGRSLVIRVLGMREAKA